MNSLNNHPPLRTALIGFGGIAAGNDDDPVMGKAYTYPSHASAVAAHPAFELAAVVDPSDSAHNLAKEKWGVEAVYKTVQAMQEANTDIDVAVIASPPNSRHDAVAALSDLKAMVLEKPLGLSLRVAEDFIRVCETKTEILQTNFWRRADRTFRGLADGRLNDLIGNVQGGLCVYGNGLRNNGIHLVDFIRMLVGEIVSVQAVADVPGLVAGPIAGDQQFPCHVVTQSGAVVHMMPVNFAHYRENGLDLWGETGRLSILQDSRTIIHHAVRPHRGLSGSCEMACEEPKQLSATFGTALYELYDNLAKAVWDGEALVSPADEALKTERVLAAILESYENGGQPMAVS